MTAPSPKRQKVDPAEDVADPTAPSVPVDGGTEPSPASATNDTADAHVAADAAAAMHPIDTIDPVANSSLAAGEANIDQPRLDVAALNNDVEEIPKTATMGDLKPASTLQETAGIAAEADAAAVGEAGKDVLGAYGFTPGAYSQREQYLQKLESEGQLEFRYVLNDGQPNNMMWLVGLKGIFSRQLPNMPREYIVRLVLDRRHRSVAVLRQPSGQVVGGITYRTFPEQQFGEIAFCAITSNEQVKGFGTRLMNHTKEYAKQMDGLRYFLTYADNNAVGYFLKQGFTKEITMPRDKWVGYIKDYDGGTLMEAVLHPRLDYTHFAAMLLQQRTALARAIRQYSSSHVEYPQLKRDPEGALPSIVDIPGITTAGFQGIPEPQYLLLLEGVQQEPTQAVLQDFMRGIVTSLLNMKEETWFLAQPVQPGELDEYFDIIKDPIDLGTMLERIDKGNFYVTLEILVADLRKMWENARTYNGADSWFGKAATKLDVWLDNYLDSHVQWLDGAAQ